MPANALAQDPWPQHKLPYRVTSLRISENAVEQRPSATSINPMKRQTVRGSNDEDPSETAMMALRTQSVRYRARSSSMARRRCYQGHARRWGRCHRNVALIEVLSAVSDLSTVGSSDSGAFYLFQIGAPDGVFTSGPLTLALAALGEFQKAIAAGHGEKDIAAVVEPLRTK